MENGKVSTTEFAELNRQVERGSLFTQATLQRGFERIAESEKFISTLTMALIAKGIVTAEELAVTIERVDEDDVEAEGAARAGDTGGDTGDGFELVEAEGAPTITAAIVSDSMGNGNGSVNQINWPSIAIRVDPEDAGAEPSVLVDCDARMHICHAVCCRLKFPLSGPEIDAGHVKWDIGHPYVIRQRPDGRCVHNDGETGHCGVYDNRPRICRQYSCVGDGRIWTDFDNMVLNQEWIDAHVGQNDLHVSAVLPSLEEHEQWNPGGGDIS